MSFTGEYINLIDQKNRVSIPAKFRNALGSINNKTFVITKGFDECLLLYPLNEWKEVESQLSQLSSIRSRDRDFVRSITRHATSIQYDAQGRIQIPDSLLIYSKIQKDASVIGMINKIEIWEPSILSKQDANIDDIADNNFDDLANEINF